MNKDIVSTNEEDKPLIFISEEAINLKRDNDKLKQEIDNLNYIIDKQDRDITSLTKSKIELKNRIKRTINYINSCETDVNFGIEISVSTKSDLLEILKEGDKEWNK